MSPDDRRRPPLSGPRPPFPGPDDRRPQRPDRPRPVGRGEPPDGEADPDPHAPRTELPRVDDDWEPAAEPFEQLRATYGDQIAERRGRLWFPHLLVRGQAGDTGERPLWPPTECWRSPDIHIFPAGTGVDLAQAVIRPRVGSAYQVGVHVWNLGRFPAIGVLVRAWWVLPGFSPNATDPMFRPRYIGGTMVDLGDRYSGNAHQIVLLPQIWTVEDSTDGHQCLFACAESFADPRAGDEFASNTDRHVAQRNISAIRADEDAASLLRHLDRVPPDVSEISVMVSHALTPALNGAVERGVSSSTDVGVGVGPVHFERTEVAGTLIRRERGWVAAHAGRAGRPSRVGRALLEVLGAAGTGGRDLLDSPALSGANATAIHLATKDTGYTIVLLS